MKTARIVIIGIVAIFLIGSAALMIKIKMDHSGDTYYTQITQPGATKQSSEDSSTDYLYTERAFDENGNEIEVSFYSMEGKRLRDNAYLSIVYNKKNGVISYSEVSRDMIPAKALKGLNQYAN